MTEVPTPSPAKTSPDDSLRRQKRQAMVRQRIALKSGKSAAEGSTTPPQELEPTLDEQPPTTTQRASQSVISPSPSPRRKGFRAKQFAKRNKLVSHVTQQKAPDSQLGKATAESIEEQVKQDTSSSASEQQREEEYEVLEQSEEAQEDASKRLDLEVSANSAEQSEEAKNDESKRLDLDVTGNSEDTEPLNKSIEPVLEEDHSNAIMEVAGDGKTSWDTRSILEHPPEPPEEEDPEWGNAESEFVAKSNDNEGGLEAFDREAWALEDTPFSNTTGTNVDIEREAAGLMGDMKEEGSPTQELEDDQFDIWETTKLAFEASAAEDVKELGVEGFDNDSWAVMDAAFSSVSGSTLQQDIQEHAARLIEEHFANVSIQLNEKEKLGDMSVTATQLNLSSSPLKDDEALLTSGEVRSDRDGVPSGEETKILNQLAQQRRIEQYVERGDDDSSESESGDESDEEDVANEEILYVSADSEDEEELETHVAVNTIAVTGQMESAFEAGSIAMFTAAAIAADDANGKSSEGRPERKLDFIDTRTLTTDSGTVDSNLMGSSEFFSTFSREGVVSVEGLPLPHPPPPPPPSSGDTKQKLLKIPPPPPEKFKKWEEEKMRPVRHLEAVAKAKVSSSQGSLGHAAISDKIAGDAVRDVTDSDRSVPFPTNFPNSHDAIEAQLSKGLSSEGSGLENFMSATVITHDDDEIAGSSNRDDSLEIWSHVLSSPKAETDTDDATSISVLSPPHVSRMPRVRDSGLAPDPDGIWKVTDGKSPSCRGKNLSPDGIMKTSPRSSPPPAQDMRRSPILDSRIAERLTLASYAAAKKFEEQYGDVDEKDADMERITPFEHADRVESDDENSARVDDDGAKPSTSFFCGPDLLGAASICHPDEADEAVDDDIMQHVSSHRKEWTSMTEPKVETKRTSPSSETSNFDRTHNTGLELVGGAFSTWKNSAYAHVSDIPENETDIDKDALDRAVAAASTALSQDASSDNQIQGGQPVDVELLLNWLESDVLHVLPDVSFARKSPGVEKKDNGDGQADANRMRLLTLLANDENLNLLCRHVSENIILLTSTDDLNDAEPQQRLRPHPFFLPADVSKRPRPPILAANFVSFLNRVSLLSGIESPFQDENPFLADIINASLAEANESRKFELASEGTSMQVLVFTHSLGEVVGIVHFFFQACGAPIRTPMDSKMKTDDTETIERTASKLGIGESKLLASGAPNLLLKVPTDSPSPFETAVWNMPSIVPIVLGFLGDPVAVCRTKMVNRFSNRIVGENEHIIMRDAVRLGGLSMHLRPAFWMWITLEKCGRNRHMERQDDETNSEEDTLHDQSVTSALSDEDRERIGGQSTSMTIMLKDLERRGREGKWHHVIQRDVSRAFGNMPPHKTGARLRTDSIVRALVTWGRGRLLMRGVKGGGVAPPTPSIVPAGRQKSKPKPRPATGPPPWERGEKDDDRDVNEAPTETVSQWSGISPVPSFSSQSGVGEMENGPLMKAMMASSVTRALEQNSDDKQSKRSRAIEELALSGNSLTNEMKVALQNQLGYILHALAAAHEDVGYCQGMDYIVAHLLRVLEDTVRWHSVRGTLSPAIGARPVIPESMSDEHSLSTQIDQAIDSSLVVEETVFRVMDTFFTTYNLRHMYWPELRCLKTCCRVFERLIQLKLPVLADHFAYHELNVGLFALGWFQTLFLYLPSMPSATVCHMWDIWLVERSFKIFFRVGTAILFLSQPILLNHELEGMMTYLNTFPDATLLNPDILIACALQIKVTNRMLAEIEKEVTSGRY